MRPAKRIKNVPPYLFAQIDKAKEEMLKKGVDIIDFGIGDPDLPTPPALNQTLHLAITDPKHQQYPPYAGTLEFNTAVADWYKKRFNVKLDPKTEVMALIGSKEGIAHIFYAFIDSGDVALIPDPAYPVYKVNTLLAGGKPYIMPLTEKNNYMPDLNKIPKTILKKAKLMFINYPNNPTGAVATEEFLEKAVAFCKKHKILLCSDFAYSEVAYDGYKPKSILEIKGAKDIAVEFHSLSKTYNVTGWRIGMVVGNAEAIKALSIIKTNVDSGAYKAIQHAGAFALNSNISNQEDIKVFEERRNVLIAGLNKLGWLIKKPKATFYVWVPVPKGETSASFSKKMLTKVGILVVPGNGYGDYGEGYVRMAITIPKERINEAISRMKKAGISYK